VKVVVRPMLVSGIIGTIPAQEEAIILINSEQPETEQAVAFWHEMLHLALGPPWIGHDEGWIESRAKALASLFPDVWPAVRARQATVGVEGRNPPT
jgi:hypothetical protein